MLQPVIKIQNISKQYRLGLVGTGTISHDLNRWWSKIRGREDPYLKIGDTNKQQESGNADYAWALKDINLEVKKGEVLGVIGKNGAGKSTLLKILSRVTGPTTGSMKVKGKIGSLLEVGTGFHPELTGRENIFLNGAILGMTKSDIVAKIDEIIEFSGTVKYIDTPVKRYSSGMRVRLAFAVAAHLDPEILVVDEVLAVGDDEFQKKALGKMDSISKIGGRTILFVSHNMAAISNLCTRLVILKDGLIYYDGDVSTGIEKYLNFKESAEANNSKIDENRTYNSGEGEFIKFQLENDSEVLFEDEIIFKSQFILSKALKDCIIDIRISTPDGTEIIHVMNKYENRKATQLSAGKYSCSIVIENKLQPGRYYISAGIHHGSGKTIDFLENIYRIEVLTVGKSADINFPYPWKIGYVRSNSKWIVKQCN